MLSVEKATNLVKRIVEIEARGWGDQALAVRRIGHRYGIRINTLERLRTGRAKTVTADLLERIRTAYLDLCERQVEKLKYEIAIEKAIAGDDDIANLEREAEAVAAKIKAARARGG